MSNSPHGGFLNDLISRDKPISFELLSESTSLPSLTLNDRQLCDLELLLNGGFSPLDGFLNQKDYEAVVGEMRLQNGFLWTMPITLDVSREDIDDLRLVAGYLNFNTRISSYPSKPSRRPTAGHPNHSRYIQAEQGT